MAHADRVSFAVEEVTSSITARPVFLSLDAIRWGVTPHFSRKKVSEAGDAWNAYIEEWLRGRGYTRGMNSRAGISEELQEHFASVHEAKTRGTFAESAGRLIALLAEGDCPECRSGWKRRITEFLIVLWRHGLVCAPAGEIVSASLKADAVPQSLSGCVLPPVRAEDPECRAIYGISIQTLALLKPALERGAREWRTLLLAVGGFEEIGDIDPTIISAFAPHARAGNRMTHFLLLLDQLLIAQRHVYQGTAATALIPRESYRICVEEEVLTRNDPAFRWALADGGQRLQPWIDAIMAELDARGSYMNLQRVREQYNWLLDYVIASSSIPDPLEYCKTAYVPPKSIPDFIQEKGGFVFWTDHYVNVIKRCRNFFDWLLKKHARDTNSAVLPFHLANPIDESEVPSYANRKGKTDREAIPLRIFHLMEEVLTLPGADGAPYGWPRTRRADYFPWLDPKTGEKRRVWSPVRAFEVLLRLFLPLRAFQVCLLDSGEGDEWVYRPGADHGDPWVLNDHPASEKGRDLGFVRRMWSSDLGLWFNGLYITTNKTADRMTDFVDPGYEIPWSRSDVLTLFCELRDFQEKYNPCITPLSRAELTGAGYEEVSPDLAARLDRYFFLFRDPCSKRPMQPTSRTRRQHFWYALLEEVENRLYDNGERNADGSRIHLGYRKERNQGGYTYTPIWDPHTTRVTGITHFRAVGVPIEILAMLVGHSSILMTFIYDKPSHRQIQSELNTALLKLEQEELPEWEAFVMSQPLSLVREVCAYNSDDALHAAVGTQSALMAVVDYAKCPNGGRRCHEGGPEIPSSNGKHAPVQGGPRNCANCRFVLTGPAFLGGLQAKFNDTMLRLQYAMAEYTRLTEDRERLVLEQRQSGVYPPHNSTRSRRLLDRVSEAVAEVDERISVLQVTAGNLWALTEQCRAILKKRREDKGVEERDPSEFALVSKSSPVDTIEIQLREATEYEALTRVVESAQIYPSIDASDFALRRGRLFDAVLALNGKPVAFAFLSDQEIVEVGNEFARMLRAELGSDAAVSDLVAGKKMLDDLGLASAVDDIFVARLPQPQKPEIKITGIETRALPVSPPGTEPQRALSGEDRRQPDGRSTGPRGL